MALPRRFKHRGPVLEYLRELHASGEEGRREAKEAHLAARQVFGTPEGRKVLELLEVSTTQAQADPLSDPRALVALMAGSLIAGDLTRMASDEFAHLLQDDGALPGDGGGSRITRRRTRG